MNKTIDYRRFAESLDTFVQAAYQLNKAYYDIEGDFCAEAYPFQASFDELLHEMYAWQETVNAAVSAMPIDSIHN